MTFDRVTVSFEELIDKGSLLIGDGYRAKNAELTGDGPLFLRSGRVTDGVIAFDGSERFSSDRLLSLAPKMGRPGDTVVTTKGNSTGVVAYVPSNAPSFVYSPHLSFWRALDPTVVTSGFIRYWARSPEFSRQLHAFAGSTDMAPYLSLADQRRLRITLPPPAEQRRIAGVLGVLDDKVEQNGELAGRLAEVLSLMFRQLLSQPWEWAPLGEQVEVVMGQSPPGTTYSSDPSGLPLVQGMAAFGERFPSTETFTSAPTKRTRHGDVLMTVRAPVGEINIADAEYCAGRGVAVIRGGRPAYTEQLMRFLEPAWREHESGTIYPSVNRVQIVDVLAPKPPDHLVQEYEVQAEPMYNLLGALAREKTRLTAVRDALLPKLVSGAIRVSDSYDVRDALGTVAESAGAAVP